MPRRDQRSRPHTTESVRIFLRPDRYQFVVRGRVSRARNRGQYARQDDAGRNPRIRSIDGDVVRSPAEIGVGGAEQTGHRHACRQFSPKIPVPVVGRGRAQPDSPDSASTSTTHGTGWRFVGYRPARYTRSARPARSTTVPRDARPGEDFPDPDAPGRSHDFVVAAGSSSIGGGKTEAV